MNSFEDVLNCYDEATSNLTDILSAFEFMDKESYKVSCQENKTQQPLPDFPFYAMIEISGWTPEQNNERLSVLLEKLLEKNYANDGVVTDEPSRLRVNMMDATLKGNTL